MGGVKFHFYGLINLFTVCIIKDLQNIDFFFYQRYINTLKSFHLMLVAIFFKWKMDYEIEKKVFSPKTLRQKSNKDKGLSC